MGNAVQIPKEIAHILGEIDPGSRIYRASGTEEENGLWYEAVTSICSGGVVSPGGAGMFAPVSRPAVHKRMKDGKLTAFLFHVSRKEVNWLGRPREVRKAPYVFVPVVELKTWAEEIKARALKQGTITDEKLEEAVPDWEGEFLLWKTKKERENLFDVLKETGTTPFQFFKMMMGFSVVDKKAIEKNQREANARLDALEKKYEKEWKKMEAERESGK
jgi:hypothetical protein